MKFGLQRFFYLILKLSESIFSKNSNFIENTLESIKICTNLFFTTCSFFAFLCVIIFSCFFFHGNVCHFAVLNLLELSLQKPFDFLTFWVGLETSDRHENENHKITSFNSSSLFISRPRSKWNHTGKCGNRINSETVASKLCVSRDLASSTIKGL